MLNFKGQILKIKFFNSTIFSMKSDILQNSTLQFEGQIFQFDNLNVKF